MKLKKDDVFELKGTVLGYNDDGKSCIFVNYKCEKDTMVYTLEGSTDKGHLDIKSKITYGSFKRTFKKHRIYVQGYVNVE